MDWIRRNWPDLLIGIALVAVIAGIIATLLTGGSFFPLGQSERPASGQAQSSSQSSPAAVGPSGRPADGPAAGVEGVGEGADEAASTVPAGGEPVADASTERDSPPSVVVSALPLPGTPVANNIPGTQDSQGEPAAADDAVAETAPATPPATNGDQPAVAAAAAQSGAAGPDGIFRVSVGAFSTRENAERQAATFRQAGFPVFIGTQGNLWLVLVGPYDDQAEAERVSARIANGDFDIEPVIYRFRPDAATAPATEPEAQRPAAPVPAAPAAQPTAGQAAGGRYLQVGAYASAQSAQPQRDLLERLGFRVTERVEGDLVKLLVGPFVGDELASARGRLNEQGIEHFPR